MPEGSDRDTSSESIDSDEYVGAYDKLVRDDIPSVVREDGNRPVTRRVDGDEYDRYLAAKLVEEATEYADALGANDEDPIAELADVHAVLDAIVEASAVTVADVRERREAKASARGRFEDGIVLERIDPSPSGERGRNRNGDGASDDGFHVEDAGGGERDDVSGQCDDVPGERDDSDETDSS
jgi:predicted house-cleaning noncanonical NTP pyrophosphatase (MazG superfamily)